MGKTKYVCQECGVQSVQWMGKCASCGSWNSFVEEIDSAIAGKASAAEDAIKNIASSRKGAWKAGAKSGAATPISSVGSTSEVRWQTGLKELDRVLGGGAVAGSFVLIGGDPGIGKSTLLLQSLEQISKKHKTLYVTGEESVEQVKMRADRMAVSSKDLLLASETNLESILKMVEEHTPDLLAVDSIQTLHTSLLESAPGTVSQVRETGARLMHLAKTAGITVIIVGHVTKDGTIAGPRVLEHMVDTVLHFESIAGQQYRVLRAVKNRFGSTNEIGVFEMAEEGLREVENPSSLFLSERPDRAPGSAVVATMEGTRPLLIEVQGLVSKSFLAVPRRNVLGVDNGRSAILLAVLEKKSELRLYERDVFLNVVGGIELDDTGCDLGIVAAVASSYFNSPLDPEAVFIGEVGLTGEVRSISRAEDRVKEAARLGFTKCYLPQKNAQSLSEKKFGIKLIPVKRVQDMVKEMFG